MLVIDKFARYIIEKIDVPGSLNIALVKYREVKDPFYFTVWTITRLIKKIASL